MAGYHERRVRRVLREATAGWSPGLRSGWVSAKEIATLSGVPMRAARHYLAKATAEGVAREGVSEWRAGPDDSGQRYRWAQRVND